MRAALFEPVDAGDTIKIGHLAESAVFSQWQHAMDFRNLRYSKWRNEGEVDAVYLSGAAQKPAWIGEIKWSDRIDSNRQRETQNLRVLLEKHKSIGGGFITTKSISASMTIEGRQINITPTAMYCYAVGRKITGSLNKLTEAAHQMIA